MITMEKLNPKFINIESDENILDEMMEAYKNCPSAVKYINSLGIPSEVVKDNITKVFDLVSDINYCKNCPGIKECQKVNPRMVTKIIYYEGYVDRQLTPCKQLMKRIEFEKQFIYRDFDDHILDKNLKDIQAITNKGRAAFIKRYMAFKKDDDTSWIYLTGAEGTGRSFLASIVAVDIARRGKGPIAFINSMNRINELRELSNDYRAKNDFQRRISILSGVPVLVIDDFGNEYKNDIVRDTILFPILQKRASRRLFTIFTSDFPIEDIVEMYSTSKAAGIRARQIGKLIKSMSKEEIDLGDISIY